MQKTYKPLVLTSKQLAYILVLLSAVDGNDMHKEIREKIKNFLSPKVH